MIRKILTGSWIASVLLALLIVWIPPVIAQPGESRQKVLVPETFLRKWDPVTIFFDGTPGPRGGGPEDNPEKHVTMSPRHPGAFQWLDEKTLQFRPAEPWPPLKRFTWTAGSQTRSLATLMSAPVSTLPHHEQAGLDPVEAITLTFAGPIEAEALAKMVTIELRPLPGADTDQSRWLDHRHFTIKTLERKGRSDPAGYVLLLDSPIPDATRAAIHLRLSLEDQVEQAFQRIVFFTAEPFQVTHCGCSGDMYPITPDGLAYSREQAIQCLPDVRKVELWFSSDLDDLSPIAARNLVGFDPLVENLRFEVKRNVLEVYGDFKSETLYKVMLNPAALTDTKQRPLDLKAPSELHLFFPAASSFLGWNKSQGIAERFGPKMVPISGRGFDRLDLRIHKVDPMDRSFWPFPNQPVRVDEDQRPLAPGEAPVPFTTPDQYISSQALSRQIKALGSPDLSRIISIPLRKHGPRADFGLDLTPHLADIDSENSPGTYLVGMRKLDGSPQREWIRLQVTDLSLTTVEEEKRVVFLVTAISTGKPVPDANVAVEGARKGNGRQTWSVIVNGRTDRRGVFEWEVPGYGDTDYRQFVRRIVVAKDNDTLVLNPTRPPDRFTESHWEQSHTTWLQWTQEELHYRDAPEFMLSHIFTERPVYRPEEPVHIKGYLRHYSSGDLSTPSGKGFIVVEGPGGMEWRYPVTLSNHGGFYHQFNEEKLPTGYYSAAFEYDGNQYASVGFQKEAYRLPKFEIRLHGPDTTPLDTPFQVSMTAAYYAGGRAADRPVNWRVTQFPYNWTPKKMDGFYYSTDARFSGRGDFRSTGTMETENRTDAEGMARITLDPGLEPTAQPRRYVVETTVTGADDQQVSNTHQVLALPPFVLGLKVPRYQKKADVLEPEIIVVDAKGELVAGQSVKVRLLQRQWHSYLKAGDFTEGAAKYVTETVDETLAETTVTSEKTPLKHRLKLPGSGVYMVVLEAADQLGRLQTVSVDLFAGGAEPVTWSRPAAKVFKVTPEKSAYSPGETAALILESPFQKARALAVMEAPDGRHRYEWVEVKNGAAVFRLPLIKQYMPAIPVHFLLMRGRVGSLPESPDRPDLGKPATLAATVWVRIKPDQHRVKISVDHPKKAMPGEEITVSLHLEDHQDQPLSGEVTLWLVDQAALALGREQELDPLPAFIFNRDAKLVLRDTRNQVMGFLPFQESPGGDAELKMAAEDQALLDKVTVRKNFTPVPYFNPAIMVDKSGTATVRIKLPDNLTNFKLRAKAVSGPDRFGFAKGMISVRLPVIVQPALPRFVRPGDIFEASAIGRVVEGEGGDGRASIRAQGLELTDTGDRTFQWAPPQPQRISYPVAVPTPSYDTDGRLERDAVEITMGVERTADKARDAFSVRLPIQPDRMPVTQRQILELSMEAPVRLPAVDEPVRPGTLRRELLISDHPALIRMAAGLSYLMNYPHGCTEQRISLARALVAAKGFRALTAQTGDEELMYKAVNDTLTWLESVADTDGLAAYWPGAGGNVSLTAWSLLFMDEARQAGYAVNENLMSTYRQSLKQALRSDYPRFLPGEAYADRSWALTALAATGDLDKGYAAELARKSQYLNLESLAQVTRALAQTQEADTAVMDDLVDRVWKQIVTRLHQGREIYGGLQKNAVSTNALILPSETRTIAQVLRGMAAAAPGDTRKKNLLVDALVTLGRDDGWGSTNADAAALLALTEFLTPDDSGGRRLTLGIDGTDQSSEITLAAGTELKTVNLLDTGEIRIALKAAEKADRVVVRSETRYLPADDGSQTAAAARGFVVRREMLKVGAENAPLERLEMEQPGNELPFTVGDVVEEHVELVNPDERHYVAVVVPIAAGMEPLNPALATAPPEARSRGTLTLAPTYTAWLDDRMAFYYDTLPKGNFHFYFRTRAVIPGRFIQPAAYAEMMYEQAVNGNSNGAAIRIKPEASETDGQ